MRKRKIKQEQFTNDSGKNFFISTIINQELLELGYYAYYETMVFPVYGDLNDPVNNYGSWVDYSDERYCAYAHTEEEALKNHEEARRLISGRSENQNTIHEVDPR